MSLAIQRSSISLPWPHARRWLRLHVRDEWWIAILAIVLSVASYAWYSAHGLNFTFDDSAARELIARRVVASRTPGLAQLGATWLPLGFLAMLPLIWNDTLFRSGLAAVLPSMLAYVLASVYAYRLGRLITSSRGAGWVAATVLMLNPSLLYMQSTAMSEAGSICAFVISIYYAICSVQNHRAADIVKCAAAVAAGTLIRYENWVLALLLAPVLAWAAWRHRGYMFAEAWTILYGMLAFAGCVAWVLYNAVVFHDPLLSFFYGQASHSYYATTPDSELPAKHHALVAFQMYGLTVVETLGGAITVLALIGAILFTWRVRARISLLPLYLTIAPFGFYWLVLFLGVNTENLAELGQRSDYNIRFGLLMLPAAVVFVAYIVRSLPAIGHLRSAAQAVALGVIMLSAIIGSAAGSPFVAREAVYGYGGDLLRKDAPVAAWFNSEYCGGDVLISYQPDPSLIFFLTTKYDFPDRAFITDANGSQFTDAVNAPERSVTWIVMNSDAGGDLIWQALHDRGDLKQYFVLRHESGPIQIYERSAAAQLAGVGGESDPGPQCGVRRLEQAPGASDLGDHQVAVVTHAV
jgi:hypothetical protein